MARSIDAFLDEPEHDGRDHTGVMGVGSGAVPPEFGDGGLGDVTLSSYLETSGDRAYNSLTIDPGGDIGVVAKRKLTLRTVGNLTVNTGRSIHADGRGWPAQAGGDGGDSGGTLPNETPGQSLPDTASVAGGGGGGGGGGPGLTAPAGFTAGAGGSSYQTTLGSQLLRDFRVVDLAQTALTHTSVILQEPYRLAIPANTLLMPGDYLDVEFAIDFTVTGGGGGSLETDVEWGLGTGDTLLTVVGIAALASTLIVRGRIYFLTSTTQSCVFRITWMGGATTVSEQQFLVAGTQNTALEQVVTFNFDRTTTVADSFAKRVGRVNLVAASLGIVPVSGGPGEPPNFVLGSHGVNPGTAASAVTANGISQGTADYAAMARALSLFGAGGGGGGGGGGLGTPPLNTGGAVGSVTGVAGFGDGNDGIYNSPSGYGGGAGASGAGGGHLVIWCGGDVTVGAGARISANGGDGGNGSLCTNGAGKGGGGGAGGGGFVGIFHAGSLTNSGTIAAPAGAAGFGDVSGGQVAGNGGAGSAGIVVTQKVA
jgi:hypothetical protein